MTDDRWLSGDAELTNALRTLYAAPSSDEYWNALESRILSHVKDARDEPSWWSELAHMARPGLAAAAALMFAASLALVHSRRTEVNNAYASVISPVPSSIEASTRGASVGDGDAAAHILISR